MTASQLELPLSSADTPVSSVWMLTVYVDGYPQEEHFFTSREGAAEYSIKVRDSYRGSCWVSITKEDVYE